jgi:hypothetical protein
MEPLISHLVENVIEKLNDDDVLLIRLQQIVNPNIDAQTVTDRFTAFCDQFDEKIVTAILNYIITNSKHVPQNSRILDDKIYMYMGCYLYVNIKPRNNVLMCNGGQFVDLKSPFKNTFPQGLYEQNFRFPESLVNKIRYRS